MKKIVNLMIVLLLFCPMGIMAQGFHFGVKGGVLGNNARVRGISDKIEKGSLTGFQIGPMGHYDTGFYGIGIDFSLLYVQRGIKLTNVSKNTSADIRTQSIDIPIELKWEMGLSDKFDLFLGLGPSFSFYIDKDNWAREFTHIAFDVLNKDVNSMGWRSTEVGFNLGGGAKIAQHFLLSCYYNLGLTSSSKHRFSKHNGHDIIDGIFDGDLFETTNRYWQVSLSYIF